MPIGKKTKNWIVGAVAVIAIIAIGVGAYKGQNKITASTTASSTDDKNLRIVKTWTKKDCSLAPWLVTDKLGFFAEEGIKLVETGETQPAQQIPSILTGDNDVASFHPNTIAVAKAGGAKITGVARGDIEPDASVNPKQRHMWWFVKPDSGIKSFADLKNKPGKLKFSTITNNICADFLANLILDKAGIPRDKVEWVSMPDVQAIQALKQGLVDVAGVHPPFYKGMLNSGAIKVADSSDSGLGEAAGVTAYIFTDEFIAKNPDTVQRFVRAITKGQKWANAHTVETAKMVEEAIGVPVTGNHFYSETAKLDESQFLPWIKDLEDNKVIPVGKVTPATLITHQFEN